MVTKTVACRLRATNRPNHGRIFRHQYPPRYGHVGTEAEALECGYGTWEIMEGDAQKETVLKGAVETVLIEEAQVDNIPVDGTM